MTWPTVTVLDPAAALPQVARCLTRHVNTDRMTEVTVWTPTASAGGRLRDLLHAEGVLLLPVIRTLAWDDTRDGPLPGGWRVATRTEERLAWHTALREHAAQDGLPVMADSLLAGQAQGIQRLVSRLVLHGVPAAALPGAVPEELLRHWQLTAERLATVWQSVDMRLTQQQALSDAAAQVLGWQTLAARMHPSECESTRERLRHMVLAPVETVPAQRTLVQALLTDRQGMLVLPVAPEQDPLAARLVDELGLDLPSEERASNRPCSPVVPVLVDAGTPMAEVRAISRIVRHAHQTGHTRVAVVCADDGLRQRIADQLREDGVATSVAGGVPLRLSTAGQLMQRVLQVLMDIGQAEFGNETMTALAALGQLPLVRQGNPALYWPELEEKLWRGVVVRNWRDLRLKAEAQITRRDPALLEQVFTLEELLAPFSGTQEDTHAAEAEAQNTARDLVSWRTQVIHLLDTLAPLWPQAWGAACIREWLAEWPHNTELRMDTPAFAWWAMQDLAGQCLPEPPPADTARVVPVWAPRDAVWQDAETLVLSGLNEGSWPAPARDDWLNTAMLERLGLPSPASQDALAGHDWQALMQSAGHIFVTRHRHRQTTETVPSRLWTRLSEQLAADHQLAASRALGEVYLIEPHDPQATRPTQLGQWPALGGQWPRTWSASWIRAVMDCPYRAVGQRLLELDSWQPFGALPDKATTGTLVHAWVEAFWRQKKGHDGHGMAPATAPDWPPPWRDVHGPLTPDRRAEAEAYFIEIAHFGLRQESAMVQRLWAPRLPRLSAALIDLWLQDAAQGRAPVLLERWLTAALPSSAPEDDIKVGAQADRVDAVDDGLVVLDFKTGRMPLKKDVAAGRQPQLPLEAWLLAQQHNLAKTAVIDGEYWQLRGYGTMPVQQQRFSAEDMTDFVHDLVEGLPRLVRTLDDKAAFPATPEPDGACKSCVLAGVCRRQEAGL